MVFREYIIIFPNTFTGTRNSMLPKFFLMDKIMFVKYLTSLLDFALIATDIQLIG